MIGRDAKWAKPKPRQVAKPTKDGVPICKLKKCGKPLGPLAIKEGDPYHSTLCCRADHGVHFLSDDTATNKPGEFFG